MKDPMRLASLLVSVLLTLLLQTSFGQGRAIAIYNSHENNNSPYWKREDHPPHSPYLGPGTPPGGGELQPDPPSPGTTRHKRSLYPNINDDIARELEQEKVKVVVVQHVQENQHSTDPVLSAPPASAPGLVQNSVDEPSERVTRVRTLIEPRFPSIDLFDEEDLELFEIDEDGILREVDRHDTSVAQDDDDEDEDDQDDQDDEEEELRYDQLWMVDEWEEDLEGDMDELMDWADDDSLPASALKKKAAETAETATVMGSQRLRDQGSTIQNALMDEDDTSPFQRLVEESWLF